jgi:hypothetical protein
MTPGGYCACRAYYSPPCQPTYTPTTWTFGSINVPNPEIAELKTEVAALKYLINVLSNKLASLIPQDDNKTTNS